MISSRRLIAYGAALTLSISSAPLATALTVGASIGGVDANASLGGSGVSASVGVGGSNTGDSGGSTGGTGGGASGGGSGGYAGGSTGGTGAGSGGGSPQGGGGYMYGSAAQSGANAKAMGYPSGHAGASAAQYQRLIGTTVLSAESLPLGTIVGIRPQKNGPPLVILSVNPALGMKQDNVTMRMRLGEEHAGSAIKLTIPVGAFAQLFPAS